MDKLSRFPAFLISIGFGIVLFVNQIIFGLINLFTQLWRGILFDVFRFLANFSGCLFKPFFGLLSLFFHKVLSVFSSSFEIALNFIGFVLNVILRIFSFFYYIIFGVNDFFLNQIFSINQLVFDVLFSVNDFFFDCFGLFPDKRFGSCSCWCRCWARLFTKSLGFLLCLMGCFSRVLFCLLGLFASEFFSFFELFSKSGSFFSCKFFSVLYFYSSCNISFPRINV